jgi:hypothetical protein
VLGGGSSKGSGGGGDRSFGHDRGSGSSGLDPSLMSLQSLAKVSKKSRLAIGKSFKGGGSSAAAGSSGATAPFGGLPRNDSNSSASSSRQGLAEALGIGIGSGSSSYRLQQYYGSSSGVPLQSSGGRSFRQASAGSYSARSETDLMTVSTNSSLSSVAPSPSVHSMHDGRGGDLGDGVAGPPAAAAAAAAGEDALRQLR